jgi:crossover junction endodeoxyribonuclease RuvC
MLVLGIDPGSQRTGWGVVESKGNELLLLDAGVIRAGSGLALEKRLAHLQRELQQILERFAPAMVGMETVFHGPNTRSLVTLGQARGSLMAAVGACDTMLVELSPGEVKKAVTGRGGATKEQVEHMVGVLLGPALRECLGGRRQLDATDALAVAIATLHREALSSLGA